MHWDPASLFRGLARKLQCFVQHCPPSRLQNHGENPMQAEKSKERCDLHQRILRGVGKS